MHEYPAAGLAYFERAQYHSGGGPDGGELQAGIGKSEHEEAGIDHDLPLVLESGDGGEVPDLLIEDVEGFFMGVG